MKNLNKLKVNDNCYIPQLKYCFLLTNQAKLTGTVCRSLLFSRTDFHVTVFSASRWFSDTIYHLKRLVSWLPFFDNRKMLFTTIQLVQENEMFFI